MSFLYRLDADRVAQPTASKVETREIVWPTSLIDLPAVFRLC